MAIDRGRTDRTMAGRAAHIRLPSRPRAIGDQIFGPAHPDARARRQPLGRRANNQHMRGLRHHRTRQQHRVSHPAYARHGPRSDQAAGLAVGADGGIGQRKNHHRRVHFHLAIRVERRPIAGVEQRIVFHHRDRRNDRVQRAAGRFEYLAAAPGRRDKRAAPQAPVLGGSARTGTSVNDQGGLEAASRHVSLPRAEPGSAHCDLAGAQGLRGRLRPDSYENDCKVLVPGVSLMRHF